MFQKLCYNLACLFQFAIRFLTCAHECKEDDYLIDEFRDVREIDAFSESASTKGDMAGQDKSYGRSYKTDEKTYGSNKTVFTMEYKGKDYIKICRYIQEKARAGKIRVSKEPHRGNGGGEMYIYLS